MKNLIYFFSITCLLGTFNLIEAQATQSYLERSPVYDYAELNLNNTDTIPDYDFKLNKLKITGTIYENDGQTPAKDVILFIEQPNENGDFDLRKENEKRYVNHRGWVKTNADGQYTFYTFVPGNDRRYNQLQQIFPVIKDSAQQEYALETFLFEEDPLLSRACRKRINKKGDPSRILKPKKEDGLLVAKRDIILSSVSIQSR
jgi:protocatechuate 3,4-dioxygenase beta subunit